MIDVRGQAAVVTGGGSGLGAEVAAQLAAHGAKELADMVLTCVRNLSLNGEVIRLDGALRMAPR